MRSSAPLRRVFRTTVSNCLAPRSLYRCLHASNRFNEQPPEGAKLPDSNTTSTPRKSSRSQRPFTDHLLPQQELTVQRGRRVKRYRRRSTENIQSYTKEELESLKSRYSPQQIAALEAGEASISPQDIIDQGTLHRGPMTLDYLDDFSKHRAVVDKKIEVPGIQDPKTGKVPEFRWKDDHDLVDDLEDWLDQQPADGGDPLNWQKFLNENKLFHSKEKDIDTRARNYVAPAITKIDDPNIRYQVRAMADLGAYGDRMADEYQRLTKQTGFTMKEINSFGIKFLVRRRVVNQTRLGKQESIYFMAIAGNGNGLLGLGEGKSTESEMATKEAIADAIRNIVPIPRYENRTIYGNVKGKSGATELELFTRHSGKSYYTACMYLTNNM